VLEGLRDTLHRSFDVRTAPGGIEGLAMLEADLTAHAIAISDMRMPGMAGDAFLREARIVAPDAVRILLTGYADVQAVVRARTPNPPPLRITTIRRHRGHGRTRCGVCKYVTARLPRYG
jgi:DNA-binding NtrC family response regulator